MGITERRERRRAELRDQILSAAARIIADEGFAALTMRKIADAIEYSPATIYLHFASRDDIAMQLVRDGFVALTAHLLPGTDERDPLERLKRIGRCYVDFARTRPQTYRLIFMEDERFASEVLARVEDDGGAFEILVHTVRELTETGAFRPLPAEAVASLLWSSLHGIASLAISCPDTFPNGTSEPTELMMDVLLRGFAGAS